MILSKVAAGILFAAVIVPGAALAYELPTCDSKVALSTLTSSVAESPQGKQVKIKEFLKVTDIVARAHRDAGYTTPPPQDWRSCSVVAATNAGQMEFHYMMNWRNEAEGTWTLQASWQ